MCVTECCGTQGVANKSKPYQTDCPDGILPTALNREARLFASQVTGEDRPGYHSAIFIETFKACFETMQRLGMVKDEYMVSEKDIDSQDEQE